MDGALAERVEKPKYEALNALYIRLCLILYQRIHGREGGLGP